MRQRIARPAEIGRIALASDSFQLVGQEVTVSQPGPILFDQSGGGDNYRLLFDWNPQPTLVWDAESLRFLAANEAAISHYGYSQDEFPEVNIECIQPAIEARS